MSVRGYAIIDGVRLIPKQVRDVQPLKDQAAYISSLRWQIAGDIERLRAMPAAYDLLLSSIQVLRLESVKL